MKKKNLLSVIAICAISVFTIGCSDTKSDAGEHAGIYECGSGKVYALNIDKTWSMKGGNPNFANNGTWEGDKNIELTQSDSTFKIKMKFIPKPADWVDGTMMGDWGVNDKWYIGTENCIKLLTKKTK